MSMEDRKFFLIPEGTSTYASFEAWRQYRKTEKAKWFEWAKKYGHTSVVQWVGDSNGSEVCGLPVDGPCPDGWSRREGRGAPYFAPTRRTKVGRTACEEMRALCYHGWDVPGAEDHLEGNRLYFVGYGFVAGKLIVSVHRSAKAQIPDAEPLKLSEYAALVEQAEAEKAAKGGAK